ncbi:hypothetical protein MMC28_010422 [Mycoblastus sanguinarius]|nr:hypothetical protein [Mycoblastus sanguinarius]
MSDSKAHGNEASSAPLPSLESTVTSLVLRKQVAAAALPNELWREILGYLSQRDLKALRLTGEKQLQMLTSPRLFGRAYIAARRGVLDTFTNLATHPTIRHHVTEVFFDSSWIDPETVTEYADDECGAALAASFKEQEYIQIGLKDRLEDAFRCLTNVRKVYYKDMSRIASLPGDCNSSVWGCDYLNGALMRRRESGKVTRDMGVCCLERFNVPSCSQEHADHHRFRRQYGGFPLLMEALSKYALDTLEQLVIGYERDSSGYNLPVANFENADKYGPQYGGITHWFFSKHGPKHPSWNETKHFAPVFSVLRRLTLTVCFFNLPRNRIRQCPILYTKAHTKDVDVTRLAALLGSAENLEELILTGEYDTAHLSFAETLSTYTWSKLRRLMLKSFEADASELWGFVQRHQSSLRFVRFDSVNLTSGIWRDVVMNCRTESARIQLMIGIAWTCGRPTNVFGEIDIDGQLTRNKYGFPAKYDENALGGEAYFEDGWSEWLLSASEYDSDYESGTSEELEYSSDDSSPSGTEPAGRRTVDIDVYNSLSEGLREQVDSLREHMPDVSALVCAEALTRNSGDYSKAYVELEAEYCWYVDDDDNIFPAEDPAVAIAKAVDDTAADADDEDEGGADDADDDDGWDSL